MAANSRMVLDSLVYDPKEDDGNSAVFDLVEGSFVFVAGAVAKTGGMQVNTPTATMGIRGTTVKVDIITKNGITNRRGLAQTATRTASSARSRCASSTAPSSTRSDSTATKWIVSPIEGETREVLRSLDDLQSDQVLITQAADALTKALARVDRGGQFVEGADGLIEDRRGERGSGLRHRFRPRTASSMARTAARPEAGLPARRTCSTRPAASRARPRRSTAPVRTALRARPKRIRAATRSSPSRRPKKPVAAAIDGGTGTEGPVFDFAGGEVSVPEDGAEQIFGFNITNSGSAPLTATITAGSTVTLVPGSGVAILEGDGIERRARGHPRHGFRDQRRARRASPTSQRRMPTSRARSTSSSPTVP